MSGGSLDYMYSRVKVYKLDRYRNGSRMAVGARVRATSEEEAKAKAAKLFYEPGDEYLPWYPERFEVREVREIDQPQVDAEQEVGDWWVSEKPKPESLFWKLIRKHDWVWKQKARWPLETRKVVCQLLWEAAIRECGK